MTQTPEQQPNPTYPRLKSGELTDEREYKIEVEREDSAEQQWLVDIKMPGGKVYSVYDVSTDEIKRNYKLAEGEYSHIVTLETPGADRPVVVGELDANPQVSFTTWQRYTSPNRDLANRDRSYFTISFTDTGELTLQAGHLEQGGPLEIAQYESRLTESDEQELHNLLEELSEELPSTVPLTEILSALDDDIDPDDENADKIKIFRERYKIVDEAIEKNTGEVSKEHIMHVMTVMFHDLGEAYISQEGEAVPQDEEEGDKDEVADEVSESSEAEVAPEPKSPPTPEAPAPASTSSPERQFPELSEEDKQWLLENNRLLYWTRKEQGSDAAIYDYKSGRREVDEPRDYAIAKRIDEAVRNDGSPYKFKGYIDAIIEITDANGEVRSIRVIGKTPYHEDNKDKGYIVLPTGDHEKQNRLRWSDQLPVDSIWDYLLSEMPPTIYDDFTHHADITDSTHKFTKMNFEYDVRQVQAGQEAKLELKNIEI